MKFKAQEIAQLLNGYVEGDKNVVVNNLEGIETKNNKVLTFLANLAYEKYLYTTGAGIVIISKDLKLKKPVKSTLIRVDNPYISYAKLLTEVEKMGRQVKVGIDDNNYVDKTAKVGKNVYIGAYAYIGKNVIIGDNVQIHPHCYIGDGTKIKENTVIYSGVKVYNKMNIGKRCYIHSNAVIGSDGFGFAPSKEGKYYKIPHVGTVVIEDDVEIGACTCIDKGTSGETRICEGAKLDNQIHIAHNVRVGKNTVIAAQVGISGSTKIEEMCKIGGKAGFSGHLNVKKGAQIGAHSGVMSHVEENQAVLGSPAIDRKTYMRSVVSTKKLPELLKQIKELEVKVALLLSEKTH